MATTTGTLVFYDSWKKDIGDNADLTSDSFIMLLTTSSYTPNVDTHTVLGDVTNELSGNGYGRETLTTVTWTESSGTATFDADDPVFTASGGSIVARFYVIYDDTVASPVKPLVCHGLLDDTPANVTATNGNTLTVQLNGSGLFTLS